MNVFLIRVKWSDVQCQKNADVLANLFDYAMKIPFSVSLEYMSYYLT